jgi:hypothetical protein
MLHHESWHATTVTYLRANLLRFTPLGDFSALVIASKVLCLFVSGADRTGLMKRRKQKPKHFFSYMTLVFKSKRFVYLPFLAIEETLHFVHTCIYVYNNGTTCVFMYAIMIKHVYLCIQ